LTDPPDFSVDALSEMLKLLGLEGALFVEAHVTAPWCVLSACAGALAMAGGGRVVFFHVVTKGRCRVRLRSRGELVELAGGDPVQMARNPTDPVGGPGTNRLTLRRSASRPRKATAWMPASLSRLPDPYRPSRSWSRAPDACIGVQVEGQECRYYGYT
jgi:hypothetical protein